MIGLSLFFLTGWAHVVCALYIPEVEFANVSTMEPIVLQSVPHERYNKVTEFTPSLKLSTVNGSHQLFFPVLHYWLCSFFLCACTQTCYICEDQGRESKAATGACMTCNKHGCRQAFHVTWWDALTWHQPCGDKDTACFFMSAASLGVAEENWVLGVKFNF